MAASIPYPALSGGCVRRRVGRSVPDDHSEYDDADRERADRCAPARAAWQVLVPPICRIRRGLPNARWHPSPRIGRGEIAPPQIPGGSSRFKGAEERHYAGARTYLVKYGERRHMTDLYEKGRLLISPASSYLDSSLNSAIRDNELTVSGIALRSELRIGIPDKYTGKSIFEAAPLSNVVCTATSIKNYFVYCFSSILDMRLFEDFGYDACVIFGNPTDLIQRVQHAVEHHCGGWHTDHQLVRYIDPRLIPLSQVALYVV